MSRRFELYQFSTSPTIVVPATAAGISGFVVDWERVGKRHRQAGADTQIGEDTVDDLRRVRACTPARILCRIDNSLDLLDDQIEAAVGAGADEVLAPMIRSAEEVDDVLERVRGRCGVGVLIETVSAIDDLEEIAARPLTRAYVGLNDLAIERGTANIFEPLVDGTLDWIRRFFSIPFGFGGLTVVDRGSPIPARLLIGELVRLGCSFSFLRRSYHADIRGREPAYEIHRIYEALAAAAQRSQEDIEADRAALEAAVDAWAGVVISS